MTLQVTSSTDLLQVGKGIAVFKKDGETTFRDLGNAPEIELTPSAETLEHFTARTGTKARDKTVTISSNAELRVVLEEWAAFNLSLLLTGPVDMTDPEHPIVSIGGANSIRGEFRFYGMNDVGDRWNVTIPIVDFLPSGSLNLISDEWGNMEITGQAAANASGVFGTMTPRDDNVNTPWAAAPMNIAEPVISGGLTEGDTLSASTGTWLGTPTSYTYVWKRNGVAIGGATAATYVLTNPDIHAAITVTVTATNGVGSDTATSATTTPTAY